MTPEEFLRARYAEERAVAEFVGPVNFDANDWEEQDDKRKAQLHTNLCGWRVGEALDRECRCGQPARTLADLEAKAAVLEVLGYANSPDELTMAWKVERRLVLPYVDHPEFDGRWLL